MGIKVGVSAQPIPPLQLTTANAVQAEEAGYDSIFYPDHLMGWFPRSLWTTENSSIVGVLPSPHIYLDTTIVMAAVGQATDRILIASGVTDPIRRPPAELARTFLTLAHVTGERAILGIGAGEKENVVPYGMDYRYQVSRLEEALQVIRLLWESKDYVDFDGRFYNLRRAVLDLEPPSGNYPPIWVAAHGPKMLGLAGRYADGWYPSYPMTAEDYGERLTVLRKAAADAGRDPEAIEAGCQMYAVITEDHETAHELMERPLVAAMSLVGSSEMWERTGRTHPFGEGFMGLRDYVPEWYSEEEIAAATEAFDPEILHDLIPHGSPDEVLASIEPYIDAGLQHLVLGNTAPLAGLEYLETAQQGMKELAGALRS